ncbi:MAG: Gfo/Idh/MocA family oxidoreductase [Planctomycetota bacterium]|nr:Gfo/Idh/MocA family oxidoreductase [Planctomycetota bacterium]
MIFSSIPRVAVVGVGHLGRHHARILGHHPDVNLVAVVDSRQEQAEKVAATLGCEAYNDISAIINKVDAVSIAAPTVLHHRLAKPFLERGIHVLVEKPLTADLDEASDLLGLAKRSRAILQVGHIERFNPVLGVLDKFPITPRLLASERHSSYSFRSTDIGVVHDVMIHDLDLILSCVSAPVRHVSAYGLTVFGGQEDMVDARVDFADGTVATLSACRASLAASRRLKMWGMEGYVDMDFATRKATFLRPSAAIIEGGELQPESLDMTSTNAVRDHVFGNLLQVEEFQGEESEMLGAELDDFVNSIIHSQRPKVTGEDAYRALELAEWILSVMTMEDWKRSLPLHASPERVPIAGLAGPIMWRRRRSGISSLDSNGNR